MSAQKRSYDKDSSNILGSYDVDSNTSFSSSGHAKVGPTTANNQTEWASKKRLRLEQQQEPLNLNQQHQQDSRNNPTLVYRETWTNQSNSEANSDSENYEDIDYGGDDDDDDEQDDHEHQQNSQFGAPHGEEQNLTSKSVDSLLNCTTGVGTVDKSGLVEQQLEQARVQQLAGQQHETNQGANEELVNNKLRPEEQGQSDEGHEKTLKQRLGPPVNYHQPRKPCKMFPNCRFGKDCLYSHPLCKFNNECVRPNCPFFHKTTPPSHQDLAPCNLTSDSMEQQTSPQQPQLAQRPLPKPRYGPPTVRCKYGANCVNQMCKFYHPSYVRSLPLSHHHQHHHAQRSDPCHFGANCLLETCPFTHPADAEPKKQSASAFKWKAQS